MILTFDLRVVGHKGRPKKHTHEVTDFVEARQVIQTAMKRTKKDREQKVISNIQLKSKGLV